MFNGGPFFYFRNRKLHETVQLFCQLKAFNFISYVNNCNYIFVVTYSLLSVCLFHGLFYG